jgi:hypothetical protein
MRRTALFPLMIVSACSTPVGTYPSLQPRAAEAMDPRTPVVRPMNDRPVSPALASRLLALVAQARSGNATFETVVSTAERLTATAGAPKSESWIAAQESLTAAIAARRMTKAAIS